MFLLRECQKKFEEDSTGRKDTKDEKEEIESADKVINVVKIRFLCYKPITLFAVGNRKERLRNQIEKKSIASKEVPNREHQVKCSITVEAIKTSCTVSSGRFIGELLKIRIISVKILHQCILRLLSQPDDEDYLECLCILLTTTGKEIEYGFLASAGNSAKKIPNTVCLVFHSYILHKFSYSYNLIFISQVFDAANPQKDGFVHRYSGVHCEKSNSFGAHPFHDPRCD